MPPSKRVPQRHNRTTVRETRRHRVGWPTTCRMHLVWSSFDRIGIDKAVSGNALVSFWSQRIPQRTQHYRPDKCDERQERDDRQPDVETLDRPLLPPPTIAWFSWHSSRTHKLALLDILFIFYPHTYFLRVILQLLRTPTYVRGIYASEKT